MKNFGEAWQLAKQNFMSEVNPIAAQRWIGSLEPVRLDPEKAFFSCPSEFEKEIIVSRYLKNIADALESVLGFRVEVEVFVQVENNIDSDNAPATFVPINPNAPAGDDNISNWTFKKYTFDNFVVGKENQLAHSAAFAVAANPGTAFNPLFIYGNSGLGKTHLMCAIGNAVKGKLGPNTNVVYVQSETFTNELVASVKEGDMLSFKNKYRSADILLVDDIQFIGGKTQTEEEFFHTFNALVSAGKQVVLTSDRPPKEIATLSDRLRTRFESGLIVDVQAPDYEMRCAIIAKKAESVGFEVSADVVGYLATMLKDNVRQLEGAVMKLRAHYLLSGRKIDRDFASEIIRDIASESEPLEKKLDKIIAEVARFYEVTSEDIIGPKRNAKIALARKVAMYLIREITELSFPLIGEKFSGRNHTTVMYSCREIEGDIKKDFRLKSEINDFLKNLSV